MKVLKDPYDLFRAMHRKRLEYERDLDDASGVARAKAAGRAMAVRYILILVGSITLDRDFTKRDIKRVRDYVNQVVKRLNLYEDFSCYEALLALGRVEGAAWALKEIEDRMKESVMKVRRKA